MEIKEVIELMVGLVAIILAIGLWMQCRKIKAKYRDAVQDFVNERASLNHELSCSVKQCNEYCNELKKKESAIRELNSEVLILRNSISQMNDEVKPKAKPKPKAKSNPKTTKGEKK